MRIDRIRLILEMAKKDMTALRLSELSGLSRATITGVRSGKSCSKRTAEKLAAILGREIFEPVDGPRDHRTALSEKSADEGGKHANE